MRSDRPRPSRRTRHLQAFASALLALAAVIGACTADPSPSSAATASVSGFRMPRGWLPGDRWAPHGWKQVFSDDFSTGNGKATKSGALPDGKWWGYYAGTRIVNSTNGVYDSSKVVSVSGGMMHFRLFSSHGVAYAAVESPILPPQRYGRYTVRYRYEPGYNVAGYKSVWMLWPNSNRWGQGEIDFNEYGNQGHRTFTWAAMHYACGNDWGCPQDYGQRNVDPTRWHTGTVMWTPGYVRVYTDGHLMATSHTQVPSAPMHLLLQTEASDYGPQAAPNARMNIDVDWVTVYTRA